MIKRGMSLDFILKIISQKRAQISIFVILGLVLLAAVVLFFVFRGGISTETSGSIDENPEDFLNTCISPELKEAIEEVSLRGGYVDNPLSERFGFEGEEFYDISYLCYNQNNYFPCINQKPALIEDFKEEIKNYVSQDMENCFEEMEEAFGRDNEVIMDYRGFDIELLPRRILVQTDSNIVLSSSGSTVEYEDIEAVLSSRIYEVVFLVNEIVNQEAEYCYAETLGIGLTYPEFIIDRFYNGEYSIYTIEHREGFEKFRFAIRGCVIPLGLGFSTGIQDSGDSEETGGVGNENEIGGGGTISSDEE